MPNTQSNTDNDIALNKEITEDNKVIVICQSKKMPLAKVEVSNHVLSPCRGPYWSSLRLLAICVSLLLPATSSMSCKQAPCLHCPGITLWLSSSSSAIPWWIPESHDVVQGATDYYNRGNSLWIVTHDGDKTTKSVGHDAKAIPHHPSGTRQSVVKNILIRKSSGTKWLHQPGPPGEGIIPNDKVWLIMVVTRHWL